MTDQAESASECKHAGLECGFCGADITGALRALEAKVRVEARRGDGWQETAEKFRSERDRLAGEVFGVRLALTNAQQVSDELRAELAAARENEARYLWLKDQSYVWPTMPCTSVDQYEPCALWVDRADVDIDAAIDAERARS